MAGHCFPGQYYDPETHLHYNTFRDYDPTTGRYIESDPIGLDGGVNTYGYAWGNPLSYSDPFGENAVAVCVGAAAADGPAPFGDVICICYAAYRGVRLLTNLYSMAESGNCGGGGGGGHSGGGQQCDDT
ncbi:MAG: RHS repeat-associated core domain-containing protein, partial [Candidatus Competibacteraceae bacterium]|nr:RHS repeat-associated core domain-containing protein [Candidatus Competibacteraceae bacterium]